MKILFVYTNINGFHEGLFSFGLASMVSLSKKYGYECKWITVNTKQEYQKVYNELKTYNPRIVAFTSVSSQFGCVKTLAAGIKEINPHTITVCGGVHPTIAPQCVLGTEHLDAVFIGESDFAFIEFLQKVKKNESYKDVHNLAYVEDGKLKKNSLNPLIPRLDILPFPDRSYDVFTETISKVGFIPFLFSRGCPYACSYCSNQAIAETYDLNKNNARYRSAESSICEIEEVIRQYPTSNIFIGDDIFGLDKRWRYEFCKKYNERIKIKFGCLLRPDLVNEEFMILLKEAGCYRISLGLESGNEYVRNTIMRRNMSDKTIIKAFDLAHKYGIQTNAINIIGTPGETEEAIWDTIKLNRRAKPTVTGVNIFYPYEGSVLGDHCFKNNLVDLDLFENFTNERRESVLKYPEEYKKKLIYFRENWETLIYPYNVRKRFGKLVRKTSIWKTLRNVKNLIKKELLRTKYLKPSRELQGTSSS